MRHLRARSYFNGCVRPTIGIVHQLDDKRPAGDDSCSSRKEVSVAEEEAIWRRIRTHAHAHRETHNFPVLSGKLASLFQKQRCLLKVSRAQRPSKYLSFFPPKSPSVTSLTHIKMVIMTLGLGPKMDRIKQILSLPIKARFGKFVSLHPLLILRKKSCQNTQARLESSSAN